MNVLFVSAVLPYPPRSGGQVRMYNLLKRLAKNHEITLVSFIREEKERQYKKDLSFCKDVVMVMRGKGLQPNYIAKALFGSYPLLLATYDNDEMRRTIAGLLAAKKFDLLHLEPFYVWPSVSETKVPIVVSEHNVEYAVYGTYARNASVFLRPLLSADSAKIKHWEEIVWKKADAVTAVSPEDAASIRNTSGRQVRLVPNGVDLGSFPFAPRKKSSNGPVILFTGDFRWFPNTDALRRLLALWPQVKSQLPKATLRIVGRHISENLAGLITASGGEIRQDVPDIAKEYRDADMLVALHAIAGGTKFKMLEAMASGLPVVTTKEGMAGLAAKAGVHYLQASSDREFVAQIAKIWENARIRDGIVREARALVEEHYGWDTIAKELDRVWKNV